MYTGRQIALFSDIHGLLYPALAILKDIKKRGITEVYSLGDNIGVGPNPSEVLDLLGEYNVVTINGNSEEYSSIGIAPFRSYFNYIKTMSQKWTESNLTSEQINRLFNNKHSYDLVVGGSKIGLCHFANDVRIDFIDHSTWTFQRSMNYGVKNPQEQFYYTNSDEQRLLVNYFAQRGLPEDQGYVSTYKEPLFGGKTIDYYDEIIQGHVHFKYLTEDEKVRIRTVRAAGIGYGTDPIDYASYIIIKEKTNGYDVEEVLVPFDREATLKSVDASTMPFKEPINKFLSRERRL